MTEPTHSDNPTTSLSQYLAPLRRQGRVVVLVTVVTLALGVVLALAGPRSYTATTSIVVLPVAANPTEALESIDRNADMATETRIAASQAVARVTSERFAELAVEVTPAEAEARLTVRNDPQDSRVIDVAYQASDPTVARVGSELAAAAYLDYRSRLNTTTVDAAREAVNGEIGILQERLVDVEQRLDQTTIGSSARLVVEVEKTSIEGELAAQQRALAGLSTLAVDIATVIDEAQEPRAADGLGPAQTIAGALAGGLVLGIIAAWILDLAGVASAELKVSLPRRRPGKADEPGDADDPFDDSDSRDPLELLKQLDAIEADPKLVASMGRRKNRTEPTPEAEPEPAADAGIADADKSFSEMYPVEYFDADGDAGALIDKLDVATDADPAEGADVATAADQAGDETAIEFESFDPSGEQGGEQFGPPPGLDALPDFGSLPPLETLTGSEAVPAADDDRSDTLPPLDELPPLDQLQPFGGPLATDQPVAGSDADDTGPFAGIPSGDPADLDPGPASWDGPFVGPTTWDELSGTASAPPAGESGPVPAADEPDSSPSDAGLVASNDLAPLLDELGRLGAERPITVLSVSDGNPTAGLTAGFEVADELRARGTKVLLVDTRIDEPALDALFPGGPGIGLAQVMSGEMVLDQAIRSLDGLEGLSLLTVGTIGPDTAGLLVGPAFDRVISQAQLDYHSIMVIGEAIVGETASQLVELERTQAVAAVTDGVIVGTGQPVGSPASADLVDALASLPAPTLHLIAAHVTPAAAPAAAPSSV